MGWLTILALSGISFGVTMMLLLKNHLSFYVFDGHYQAYQYYAYTRSYTRAPAYFVGIVAAWLLNELEKKGFTRETRPSTRRAKAFAILIACIAGTLLVGLIFIPVTNYGSHKNSWDQAPLATALYITFSRPLWCIGCAAVVLLCYYGYLPIVDGFLAHPCWTPLARLTYGAYLVHPILCWVGMGRAMQFLTFTFMGLMSRFFFNCVVGFSVSVVLWVLIERPCLVLFSPSTKPRAQKSADQLERVVSERAISAQPLVLPNHSEKCPPTPDLNNNV